MSLADALLSDSDFESDDGHGLDVESNFVSGDDTQKRGSYTVEDLLTVSDLHEIGSVESYVPVLKTVSKLSQKLDQLNVDSSVLSDEEQMILKDTNTLISQIHDTFQVLNTFIKENYQAVWPNLENIIKNPLLYVRIIKTIGFDLTKFKQAVDELTYLSKDQVLSLTISVNLLLKQQNYLIPDDHIQGLILQACSIQLNINDIQLKFRNFIRNRCEKIAPNLTALTGSMVSSQLISSVGLETLVATPACNIPSIGKAVGKNGFGYIYQCDLVKNMPQDCKKQAMRQVSSKIVMAARIDYSTRGDGDASLGTKWRGEIAQRLEKLIAPPENVKIKPLAKPVDMKSKRRGGRKFKKMRDRMKMSEVEKAQNKMLFGEAEVTKLGSFGDEIGLGMLGKLSIRDLGPDAIRKSHMDKSTNSQLRQFNN